MAWLDEHEERAWRGFVNLEQQVRRRIGRELQRNTGLSEADYEVLVHLTEAPEGRLRPYQLGRVTQWEKSRLSHHLSRMAERGLVERQFCPTDNRGSFVAVTEAGRAAIAAAAPQHVEDVRRLFIDLLSPEQLDALADISDTVLESLAAECTTEDVCSETPVPASPVDGLGTRGA